MIRPLSRVVRPTWPSTARRLGRSLATAAICAALASTALVSTSSSAGAAERQEWSGGVSYSRNTTQSGPAFCTRGTGTVTVEVSESWTFTVGPRPPGALPSPGTVARLGNVGDMIAIWGTLVGSATWITVRVCNGVEDERRTIVTSGSAPWELTATQLDDAGNQIQFTSPRNRIVEGLPGTDTTEPGSTEPGYYWPAVTSVTVTGTAQPAPEETRFLSSEAASVGEGWPGQYTFADATFDDAQEPLHIDLVRGVYPECVPADAPAVDGTAYGATAFGSRAVTALGYGPRVAGVTYEISWGDDGLWHPFDGNETHQYAAYGEKAVTFRATDGNGCWRTRTKVATADAVSTYLPTVRLHDKEKYFPDSVEPFLAAAVLVHDTPNTVFPIPRLPDKGFRASRYCPDYVVAAGPNASVARLKDERPHTKTGKGKVPTLVTGYLSGKAGKAYRVGNYAKTRKGWRAKCSFTGTYFSSNQTEARKNGSIKGSKKASEPARDDGLVLAMDGAKNRAVLTGDRSLTRAKVYAVRSGQFISYWFFYPNNVWTTGPISERHEGDWEHITVQLDASGVLVRAAFFAHYCSAAVVYRSKLTLDGGTHPTVWAALGGHASYSKNVGVKLAGSCALESIGEGVTDRTSSNGKAWRPWQRSASVVDATKQSWYGFRGAWGDPHPATVSNYGPEAPGAQPAITTNW